MIQVLSVSRWVESTVRERRERLGLKNENQMRQQAFAIAENLDLFSQVLLCAFSSSPRELSVMSHFGRSGPPDIRDTFSLLVLNISFRTSADQLFPLFDRYGKVVDIFIPRDRRSGDSRGFAFIRYKHSHEAQKAIERLDGRNVDGRNISVQFAKYGREMETIQRGRITRENFNWKRSQSRSPKRSRRDNQRENDHYQDRHPRHERRRHRSRSYSPSRSRSPDSMKADDRSREDDRRNPRRRTPDRRASPQSSRDSSPRKASMSPAPDRHLPRASISPAKRRASPTVRNGAGRSRSRTPDSRSRSASLKSDAEDQ